MPAQTANPLAVAPPATSAPASPLPELPAGPTLDRIRPAWEIPLFETWQLVVLSVGFCFACGWLILFLLRRLRAVKNVACEHTPYETALASIDTLAAETNSEALCTQLLHTVSGFLESTLQVSALGRRCPEILKQLQVDTAKRQQLEDLWAVCEHAKFGQASIDADTRIQLLDTSREIIHSLNTHISKEAD